eukprot:2166907-Pleurochrysis_carterae.AAC.1
MKRGFDGTEEHMPNAYATGAEEGAAAHSAPTVRYSLYPCAVFTALWLILTLPATCADLLPFQASSHHNCLNDTMVLRLLVSNLQVGTIIGKGGANIKGIREMSGCRMQIADMVLGSTERLISVTGSVDGITKAVELMLGVIEEPGSKTSEGGSAALNPGMASEGTGQSHTLKLVLDNNQASPFLGTEDVLAPVRASRLAASLGRVARLSSRCARSPAPLSRLRRRRPPRTSASAACR